MQTLGISKQLCFINKSTVYKATVSFYKFNDNIEDGLYKLLHPKEISRANSYTQQKRKDSYLLGRISGKLAIEKHLNLTNTDLFYIDNGVLNQPVIIGLNSQYLQISLSHTIDIGATIISEEGHPIGIDIESLNEKSSIDVMSILSENEKNLLKQTDPIILWTAKESLSKCLKTGFTVPFEWFEIDKIVQLKNNCFEIYFLNLQLFKSKVLIANHYVVAFSYHIDSDVTSEEWLDIQQSLIKYQAT